MKLYLFTNKENQASNLSGGMEWGENITHKISIRKEEMSTIQPIYAYGSDLLAVLMGPIYVYSWYKENELLWECKGDIIFSNNLIFGCKKLTTLKKVSIPIVNINERIAFAILCALEVYNEKNFTEWANNWLKGKNRSEKKKWEKGESSAMWAAIWAIRAAIMEEEDIQKKYVAFAANSAALAAAENNIKINFTQIAKLAIRMENKK